MIKSENGGVHLRGTKDELLADLAIILDSMRKSGISDKHLALTVEMSKHSAEQLDEVTKLFDTLFDF